MGKKLDLETVRLAANGQWPTLLSSLGGISSELLDGKHHPCPKCDGEDRFRMIDELAGALFCNQCFSESNGDGFAALMWLNGCKFPEALKKVADYLGISAKPSKNDPAKDLEFQSWSSDLVKFFTSRKPGVTEESLLAAGAKFAKYKRTFTVIALPIIGESLNTEKPVGWVLLNYNGGTLPKWNKQGEVVGQIKMKMTYGSKPGLIGVHGIERLKTVGLPELVWKVEGVTDLLALWAVVPEQLRDRNLVVTNANGASETPRWQAQLLANYDVNLIHDADEPGQAGATKWTKAIAAQSDKAIKNIQLPYAVEATQGKDIRDWLEEGHAYDDLLAIVEATPKLEPRAGDQDNRSEVIITPDEHLVNESVAEAFSSAEGIFQRSGRLVHVTNENESESSDHIERTLEQPRIADLPIALVREKIVSCVHFLRGNSEELKQAHPPDWCVKAIYARGFWPGVKRLSGIATSPILRPDGTILCEPGYDPTTALYLTGGSCLTDIPENPTLDQACVSIGQLLNVVCDFPFERTEHASEWLALVLTPLARHAFEGPAPLHLIDANVRGSGKSLLADLASIIVQGRNVARMNNPRDDEEAQKVITSLVIAGDPLILIDNIVGGLGCASIDAALTGTTWRGRILGKSELIELPLLATWAATGNNVVLRSDTSRRVLHIRLQSLLEQPETRTGFQHGNVREYVTQHRDELLSAALTVLRGFIAAGRPNQGIPPWGSFEGWSELVRQTLVWAGQPDPNETRQELVESGDRELLALRALIQSWPSVDASGHGLTSRQIFELLKGTDATAASFREAMYELCPPSGTAALPSIRQIGTKLSHVRKRVVGDRALDYRVGRGRIRNWLVVDLASQIPRRTDSESPQSPERKIGDLNVRGDTHTSIREISK